MTPDPFSGPATFAATHGGYHVIADTRQLDETAREKFQFLSPSQQRRIGSEVAWACEVTDVGPYAVLVADSDQSGALEFDPSTVEMLKSDLKAFGSRMIFEADMV